MPDNAEGRYLLLQDAVAVERWFAEEFIKRMERITVAIERMAAYPYTPPDTWRR